MAVYVDSMQAKFRNMVMCHMIADTENELHKMAARIGVARKWYQGDHYDITMSKRALAVAAGALEVSWRDCGLMMVLRRRDPGAPLVTAAQGEAMIKMRCF